MTGPRDTRLNLFAPSEVELAAARAIPDLLDDVDLSWTVGRLVRSIWEADLLLWMTLYTINDDGSIHLRGQS